jgi:uncharacterized membrane-anchored protein YitT (DUF2179 family)
MTQKESPKISINWKLLRSYSLILVGVLIQGVAMRLFLIPSQLISGGVSGAAQILNALTGWNIGLMILIGNIPLFFLGWRYLGGLRFSLRTAVAVIGFSFFTD